MQFVLQTPQSNYLNEDNKIVFHLFLAARFNSLEEAEQRKREYGDRCLVVAILLWQVKEFGRDIYLTEKGMQKLEDIKIKDIKNFEGDREAALAISKVQTVYPLEIVCFAQRFEPSISCPQCGKISHNQNDIIHKYCGYCHQFHSDMKRPSFQPQNQAQKISDI
jgi:hypothetical protein